MSNEIKSFGELAETVSGGKSAKPELVARLEFSCVGGKIFRNGLNIVHNCVFNEDNARFIYRDTQKAGKHFAVEYDGKYVGRVFCSEPGNYITSVYRDYMGVISVKSEYDKPIELETDPIRIALRQRKIFPSKKMIVQVQKGTPLAYSTNKPQPRRSKAPAGARTMSFTSDGVERVDEHMQPGIKDGPITGKVKGATFLIQYSTIYGRRGKPRRWIDKVVITPGVQMVKLEEALDKVMDVRSRPAQLIGDSEMSLVTKPEPVQTPAEALAEAAVNLVGTAE